MKRVLHIVNKWEKGGVERYVEGLVEATSAYPVRHGILSMCTPVNTSVVVDAYGPLSNGGGIFGLLGASIRLKSFLMEHRFDIVHVHASNASCYLYANIAERCGVPVRIVHSHSSSMIFEKSLAKRALNNILFGLYSGHETMRIGCSTEAARALFKTKDSLIIPNGIDIERFKYSQASRDLLRGKLGIENDCFVVLCVGSLLEVKNHARAISIFEKLQSDMGCSRLVLVGDGPLRPPLEAEVERKGLSDRVIFAGFIEDVSQWYSLADVLLFPSLYEGFPITLVEAQANGLPVVCSDSITREVGLLKNCRYVSLDKDDADWATLLASSSRISPAEAALGIKSGGLDLDSSISKIEKAYGIL